jgi:AraC family L-rhamnose operon transcriptional activator RhaR
MHWIERLNRTAGRANIGAGTTEILSWAHAEHLVDNVPHRHTYFEVCLVGRHGAGIFTVEGKPHSIGPGDVFFARPGVIHQIQNTQPQGMELFWVSWAWSPHSKGENERNASTLLRAFSDSDVLVVPDDGRVAALWNALRAVSGGPILPGSETQIAALSSSLLLALSQLGAGTNANVHPLAVLSTQEPTSHRTARLALRYIHDNLERRLPLEEVAVQVHVSPRHLTRLLRDFTGTSPADYIEQARIHRACALLREASTPIKEIARHVGYPDVHHFTRVFTRRCGVAPGTFRDGKGNVPNVQKHGALV